MKHLFFSVCFFLMWGGVFAQSGAAITWDKNYFDFGDVVKGAKVEHTFKFTNTGTEPLVITNVEVTCGCTTPKGWPRDPIAPGTKAEISVQFDSTNKMGRQNKVVVIVSNASAGNSQITFSANVLPAKPQE
ncbi:MAG: DUF1573 domain-containing protein [Bacteroidetes bacterium]|nr:DUF1573 domain-containing protein [Bacteroidota bacterium]MBS1539557.1 DUF1573 domain-containing protein [Bacteroidota bacterium]